MKIRKQFILSFFALFIGGAVFAQMPEDELKSYKQKYPLENIVVLNKQKQIFISVTGEKLNIKSNTIQDNFYIYKKAAYNSDRQISSSEFYELGKISAYSLVPNGKKYKKYKVSEFKEKDDPNSGNVFYSDSKETSFLFEALKEGAKTHLEYERILKEPRFLEGYYFSFFNATERSEFIVTAPKNLDLKYKLFNGDKLPIKFTKTEKGNNYIYKWEANNIPQIDYYGGAPDTRYYLPHIELHIGSYTTASGKKVNLLNNVDDLYGWYKTLVKGVNKKSHKDLALKSIADSLTANCTTEFEKVQTVYHWVQTNIKYIAFEAGMGGFVPREANDVCRKRYGDCKDMASIITKMLDLVDVKAYKTWIGSRDIPYGYSDLPTPGVDNHMIAAYIDSTGNTYFLDATDSDIPINMPSSFIQGKEALIGVGEEYKLVKVPVMAANKNKYSGNIQLSINKNKIEGKGAINYTGYYKIDVARELYSEETYKERFEFMSADLEKGSNKFLLDTFTIKNETNKYLPTEITYSFNVDDYVRHNDNEIYVNLNLNKFYIGDKIKEERKIPIDSDYHFEIEETIELKIPEGYKATFTPTPKEYKGEKFGYSISYEVKNNKVIMHYKLHNSFLILEADKFSDWNDMVKSLSKAYKDVIVLKK